MKTRFGSGFEKKSELSPSTQDARAHFLGLLPSLKEKVVPHLFEIAYQPFLDFINASQKEIADIARDLEIEPSDSTTEQAVRLFIFGWHTLHKVDGARLLTRTVRAWGTDLNLADDWCLDHAVKTLRSYYLGQPSYNYLDAWHDTTAERRLDSLLIHDVDIGEFKNAGLDKFHFKYEGIEFRVEGPFFKSTPEFRQGVKQAFIAAGGKNDWGALQVFDLELNEYLQKVISLAEKLNLKEPSARWATENHFMWLIEYQIPERLDENTISQKYSVPQKTVDDGIKAACRLIGLSKPAESLKGRKRGKGGTRKLSQREETAKKARLSRFINACEKVSDPENRAAMARALGLSDNYFRRVWIPYLIDKSGCRDYGELIQRKTIVEMKRRHSELQRI
jgi:hypothetical protein